MILSIALSLVASIVVLWLARTEGMPAERRDGAPTTDVGSRPPVDDVETELSELRTGPHLVERLWTDLTELPLVGRRGEAAREARHGVTAVNAPPAASQVRIASSTAILRDTVDRVAVIMVAQDGASTDAVS